MPEMSPLWFGPACRLPHSPLPQRGIKDRRTQWTAASTCTLDLYFLEGFHYASTDL